MYKLEYLPVARKDMLEIVRYISRELQNPDAADRLAGELVNAAEGVLQDIHWSMGDFGYFPSYALGSAFGAQIYAYMKTQMDFEGLLREGKISVIREFLRENIHKYGKMKTSRQILKDVTGEDFNPKYYVEYLKEKYSNIYQL